MYYRNIEAGFFFYSKNKATIPCRRTHPGAMPMKMLHDAEQRQRAVSRRKPTLNNRQDD